MLTYTDSKAFSVNNTVSSHKIYHHNKWDWGQTVHFLTFHDVAELY